MKPIHFSGPRRRPTISPAMPPYPMMPFTVDAFLKLREELSAKWAAWRGRAGKREITVVVVNTSTPEIEQRPLPMARTPARRAA